MDVSINKPQIGMKFVHPSLLKDGEYSLLVNGNISSFGNTFMIISNEPSNLLCKRFAEGFKVIGVQPVISLDITFFFLVNPDSGESEIGFIKNAYNKDGEDLQVKCKDCVKDSVPDVPLEKKEQSETCDYQTFVNANCLNFDYDHPIKSWVKVDDCNVRMYFIDDTNPIRYIDYPDYQKVPVGDCPKEDTQDLDCFKIKVFKTDCFPKISTTDVVSGGENIAGVYQFAAAYSDAYGNQISSYHYITNPVPLFDKSKTITTNTDYPIAKSIKLHIEGLNKEFDWFNLVVIRTVNLTSTAYLVGTFSVSSDTFDYTFTGVNLKQDRSLETILALKPVYSTANILAESNGILFNADVTEPRVLNLQPFVNKLNLKWQTVEFDEGAYSNPIVANNYVQYLRDELYGFAIEFWRTDGLKTARFHIPGREATSFDLDNVAILNGLPNPDVFSSSACETPSAYVPRWQVYNTGSVTGYACGYNPSGNCDNPITTSTTCTSNEFFRDPATGLYYRNYNISTNTYTNLIANPCTDVNYRCGNPPTGDCLDAIVEKYGTDATITFKSCDIQTIRAGQSQIIYTYDETGGTIPTPTYPPSGLVVPTHTACESALLVPNCGDPFLAKLEDHMLGTTTQWYSFFAASTVQAVTVTSIYNQTDGNTFSLYLHETTNGYCDTLSAPIQVITQNTPYFFLSGLTVGVTYYFEIVGNANVSVGVNDFYYICSTVPDPTGSSTVTTADIVQNLCNYDVEYCVVYNPCTGKPYQEGEFSYWESSELYPCNEEVWGSLAGKPIRHHKFPDCKISPHYRNINTKTVDIQLRQFNKEDLFNTKNKIYPIGILLDVEDVKSILIQAVEAGKITEEEKQSICGYRIVRTNRRGNESIIAKGLLYDVWKYRDNMYKTNKDVLYANYPYNSVGDDVFNLQKKLETSASPVIPIQHPFFSEGNINNKYTFLGANTLFNNPGLGQELKLELEQFGISEGKYTQVINHPKYQYAGIGAVRAAYCMASLEATFETIATLNAGGIISAAILSSIASMLWGTRIPPNYYDWLDVIKKLAPFKNFAYYYTSVGNYTDFTLNRLVEGNIRRFLNDAQYLNQGVSSVQDGANRLKFNNYKRESSVYLNINDFFNSPFVADNSRWYPGDGSIEGGTCANPSLGNGYRPISSFYGSLKNELINQYGQVDQIDYIDAGYNGIIDWYSVQDTTCTPIFGGDTFINRFSVRRQMSFFIQDAVGMAPNTDIQYNELSNVGYPQFFFSYPSGNILTTQSLSKAVSSLYGDVVLNNDIRRDYNFPCDESSGQGIFRMALQALGLSQAVLSANAISGAGALITNAKIFDTFDLSNNPVFPAGKFFLYSYGVPSFITESNYNLDYRYGTDQKQGNFYPNISDVVSWTQPTAQFNLINFDNTYNYNLDYSKQNHENNGYVLNPDFEQTKEDCKVNHPNRVIYSLQDNDNNDRFDGNSIYLANNYHDFPKAAGKLSIIKGIENNKVLVIQENQASVFNAFNTLEADIKNVAVGSGSLFNQQLQEYVKTDLGFGGSQTQAITTCEYGTYWVDNKRGQVIGLSGSIQNIIPEENTAWFKENLPFKLLKYFPEASITNPYKGAGMNIWWDDRFKRVFFSKKDYIPHPQFREAITFSNNNFYYNNEQISLKDPTYFCDNSFTIAYSPILKNFISFYSFIPDYTNSLNGYFQTGLNDGINIGVYNHLLTHKSYTVFYGEKKPFIFEYVSVSSPSVTQLISMSYQADFLRYIDELNTYKENSITYSHAILYNQNQSTGTLNLIPKQKNNLYQAVQYPKVVDNQTQILVDNVENIWRFNQFSDISIGNNEPLLSYQCNPMYKEVNLSSVSYTPTFFKNNLRSDYTTVRLEDRIYSNYNILHHYSINQTKISKI